MTTPTIEMERHDLIYTEAWADEALAANGYKGGGSGDKNLHKYLQGDALVEVLMALKVKDLKSNRRWKNYGYRFRKVVSPRNGVPMILTDLIPLAPKHNLKVVGA